MLNCESNKLKLILKNTILQIKKNIDKKPLQYQYAGQIRLKEHVYGIMHRFMLESKFKYRPKLYPNDTSTYSDYEKIMRHFNNEIETKSLSKSDEEFIIKMINTKIDI